MRAVVLSSTTISPVRHRREIAGPRPDDDSDFAAADTVPLIMRSPSESPLCWIATRSPNAARKGDADAGVNAISGTSISAYVRRPKPLR
jgi:hypothetical protein